MPESLVRFDRDRPGIWGNSRNPASVDTTLYTASRRRLQVTVFCSWLEISSNENTYVISHGSGGISKVKMAQAQLPPKLKASLQQSKCEYRQLGSSGLRVSVPIFGCMSFGDPRTLPWAIGEEEVR